MQSPCNTSNVAQSQRGVKYCIVWSLFESRGMLWLSKLDILAFSHVGFGVIISMSTLQHEYCTEYRDIHALKASPPREGINLDTVKHNRNNADSSVASSCPRFYEYNHCKWKWTIIAIWGNQITRNAMLHVLAIPLWAEHNPTHAPALCFFERQLLGGCSSRGPSTCCWQRWKTIKKLCGFWVLLFL